MLTDVAIAFASGTVLEGLYAYSVIVIAKRQAVRAAIGSMIWITVLLLGLGEAFKHPTSAAALVLGYGVGAYLATRYTPRENS